MLIISSWYKLCSYAWVQQDRGGSPTPCTQKEREFVFLKSSNDCHTEIGDVLLDIMVKSSPRARNELQHDHATCLCPGSFFPISVSFTMVLCGKNWCTCWSFFLEWSGRNSKVSVTHILHILSQLSFLRGVFLLSHQFIINNWQCEIALRRQGHHTNLSSKKQKDIKWKTSYVEFSHCLPYPPPNSYP